MNAHPGLIVLLGSGETSASIRKVYNWLFEYLNSPIHISILETPAGFEPNSDLVAGQMADFMRTRLQNYRPSISIIPVRKRGTAFSPDDREIIAPMLQSNVIMMGPGSPTYAVRQLHDSAAWHAVISLQRLGTTLIFASATTIASGAYALPVYEIYKVGEDLHWKPGLNLLEPYGLSLVFIPHWNNNDGGKELDTSRCYMGRSRFNQLRQMLASDFVFVGIDEHTALVIDPTAGTCQVMGNGDVTLVQDGAEKLLANGETHSLCELGPFVPVAKPESGIPPELWDWVIASRAEAQQNAAEDLTPPSEVLVLADQRDAARAEKDWAVADRLRNEIEAMRWKVLDTPEGSKLEPTYIKD